MNTIEKIKQEIKKRLKFHEKQLNSSEPYVHPIDSEENEIIDTYNPNDYFEMKARRSEDIMALRIIEQNTKDIGEVSDGYHTFNELYDYRMLYNAAFFNSLAYYDEWADGCWEVECDVHKSKKHSDGEDCFGGGWFIVMAELPTGQISNHYEMKYWDLFKIPEKEKANKYDGHTPQQAAERLKKFILNGYS